MQDQPPPPAGRKQDHPTGDPTAGAGGGGGYDEDAALAQAIAQSLQEQEKVSTDWMALCCVRTAYSQSHGHHHTYNCHVSQLLM